MNTPPTSLILGANGHVGAYLARLLQARGQNVVTVADPDGTTPDALAQLGIAADVEALAAADTPAFIAGTAPATIYAINHGHPAASALHETALAAATGASRFIHVVDRETLLRHPAAALLTRKLADMRRDTGLAAATAILGHHDSRLGPADNLAARITAAAWHASRNTATAPGTAMPLELPETGPRDWGWTPEYVDAVQRLAAMPAPRDLVIASGHALTTAEFAHHAFAFFGLDAATHIHIAPGDPTDPAAETAARTAAAALKAATGWSASTWGRDLVRALCEGAAGRSTI